MSAMHESAVISFSFYLAFAISIGLVIYALALAKRMHYSGTLYKTILFAGLGALTFGVHHLGEIFLEGIAFGVQISETVEWVAAIFLLMATYNLYKVATGVNK